MRGSVRIALGVVLGALSASAQEDAASPGPAILRSAELEPIRAPDHAETFQVEEVAAPAPETSAEAGAVDVAPTFRLAPDSLPVPPDVMRSLSRVLQTPASYGSQEARCTFAPSLALRFHQAARAVDVLVSFHCIDLAFQPVGASSASPALAFGPAAWELLDLLRRSRPADSRLYHVQIDWSARGDQARQAPVARKRWVDAMPEALRPFWEEPSALLLTYEPKGKGGVKFVDADVEPQQTALASAVQDPTVRIRALLHWYGSGAGPWSGYPSYEGTAALLLLAHTTPELLAAARSAPLTAEQKEGAARLFAGWEFTRERPKDGALVPAELRTELLEHTRLGRDDDKRRRAEAAFAGP